MSVLTVFVSIVIGQRYGSDHDFERTLGMMGTLTGTTPTGLALVRILDPGMRTRTMAEMGLMNLPEMAYLPAMLTISAAFAGSLTGSHAMLILAGLSLAYLLTMLLTRSLGPRTWRFDAEWMRVNAPTSAIAEGEETATAGEKDPA